jgi:ubiquinone/menaquinone biosynthesis C-methylase UbiE
MASHHDVKLLEELVERLPHGARVLDVGCGAGIPVTRFLVRHFSVLGIDISEEQINLARVSVPSATFIRKDMTRLGLDDASFEAIVSFYAIFHLPHTEYAQVFTNFFRLLKPGGLLLVCLGNGIAKKEWDEEFFGVSMYYSTPAVADSVTMLTEAGFDIVWQKDLVDPLHDSSSHLFVLAEKPRGESA